MPIRLPYVRSQSVSIERIPVYPNTYFSIVASLLSPGSYVAPKEFFSSFNDYIHTYPPALLAELERSTPL